MAALLSTQSKKKKTKLKKREKEKRNGFGGLHFSISSHPEKVRIEDANTTYKMTWWVMALYRQHKYAEKKHAEITSVTVQIHLCMSLVQNI